MPSKILVEQIAHTNDTSAIDIDSSGNMVLQKELKFGATGAIKNSAGNAILQESGGNVTIANVRLSANGGISDSSGNSVLTESGGNVSIGNVRLPASGGISDSSGNAILTESAGTVTVGTAVSIPSSAGGVPAGAIMSFAMSSAPTGWLVCNGGAISRTAYAGLFAAIGTTWGSGDGSTTFNVPDLRGEFLRGFANGSTNDPDRTSRTGGDAVGSSQSYQIQAHRHDVRVAAFHYGSGTAYRALRLANSPVDYGIEDTGGNETRPRNKYVQFCIKY